MRAAEKKIGFFRRMSREKFEGKWSKVGMPDHGTSNSCTYIQGKGGKHK